MNQSSTASLQTPASGATDRASGSLTPQRRFECAIPDCRKVFRRKEHLTRHQKSHDAQLQYACHICGRRYARSDVLKRHIEFHPQYYKPKRDFVACTRCREGKTKCDEGSPCKPCSRRELHCIRANSSKPTVYASSTTLELPLDISSPPSSLVHTSDEPKLREYIVQDPAAMRRRLDIYFAKIHPSWPILQPSMITAFQSPDLLIASIMMLASWLEGDLDHLTLFPLVLEGIAEIELVYNMLPYLLSHK
ncbi:hypothetical protein ANO14919_052430 [Xylariales sp. No.14919]|nr:hypothetical protein ANO14919_052430 [Xylariales sp. No.14919]